MPKSIECEKCAFAFEVKVNEKVVGYRCGCSSSIPLTWEQAIDIERDCLDFMDKSEFIERKTENVAR